MSSLLSIGILNPWGIILALPIVGALIYAYLRKQKLVSVVIPSLFLLRDLAQPVSTRRSFVPPPRFWFELLLLSLLLLCFIGLFHTSKAQRYGLLFDNSLSTAAHVGTEPVISLLRERAERALKDLPGDAIFELYKTSPQIERIGGEDIGKAELIEALAEIQPAFAIENFSDQIPQVMQRGQYSGLLVVTDRQLELPASASEMKRFISLHNLALSASQVPQNLALSEISFERNPEGVDQGKLHVSISAYTRGAVSVPVIVERLDRADAGQIWKAIQQQTVTLAPMETKGLTFPLSSQGLEGVRARIDSAALATGENSLSEDDRLFFSFRKEARLVYVVSARTLQELGIEKIRGIKFRALSVDQFQQVIQQDDAATFLLVDFIPNGLPDKNLIIVSPPHGTGGFEVERVIQGAELTEWKSGHPLLTYIDTATIRLSRFVPLTPPLWGESIISTSRGSALFAGERGARRTVVTGFDLFPYRGRVSPTISVLFLNMLRWVSADPLGGRLLNTYEPVSLVREVGQLLSIGDTVENQSFIQRDQQNLFTPTVPGIYLGLDGKDVMSANAVNFISAHESDLLSRQEVLTISGIPGTPDTLEKQRALADILIPLLLVVVLLDLFYLLIRLGRKRSLSASGHFRGRAAV